MIHETGIRNLRTIVAKEWCAFFSQTGTELANIIKQTGREPDRIITNLTLEQVEQKVNPWLWKNYKHKIYHTVNRPTVHDYINAVGYDHRDKILTMHGWLRIIPQTLCHRYQAFNGHPGLITKYPELRGKDPQLKAHLGNYDIGGSVIHEITPELDEGPILLFREVSLKNLNLDDTFRILSEASLDLWIKFFEEITWLKE